MMADLPSKHSFRIATAKGAIPKKHSLPTSIAVMKRAKGSQESMRSQASGGTKSPNLMSPPSISTETSVDEDIFSLSSSLTSTTASSVSTASAFAQGWKAAMHQTSNERPPVYSDIERFALDVTETLDACLANGQKLNQTGSTLCPDDSEKELFFPALFRSVCICDVSIMGHPIALHSKHFDLSPRGLKVGQAQFLNLPCESRDFCHLAARAQKGRQTQYILEYVNDLVSVEGDKQGYVVATQMNVTDSIDSVAELLNARFWMTQKRVPDGSTTESNDSSQRLSDVDWCEIAQESPATSRSKYEILRKAKDKVILNDPTVLEFCEMIEDIRYFHKEYFALTTGQESTGSEWKINYVSPSLKKKIDDVQACFKHTKPSALVQLSSILSGQRAGSLLIKWGVTGEAKRLYCCPMFRDVRTCWLCFLTREDVGDVWDLRCSTMPPS